MRKGNRKFTFELDHETKEFILPTICNDKRTSFTSLEKRPNSNEKRLGLCSDKYAIKSSPLFMTI